MVHPSVRRSVLTVSVYVVPGIVKVKGNSVMMSVVAPVETVTVEV